MGSKPRPPHASLRAARLAASASPQRLPRKPSSEAEHHIQPGRPAGDVRPPQVRGANADPLDLPQLVEEIERHAAMDLIEIRSLETIFEIPIETNPSVIAAGAQLVAVELHA